MDQQRFLLVCFIFFAIPTVLVFSFELTLGELYLGWAVGGVFAALIPWVARRRRSLELRRAAGRLGFSFTDTSDIDPELTGTTLFSAGEGDTRKVERAVVGQRGGADVRYFDYEYQTDRKKWRRQSVAIAHYPTLRLPHMCISPHGWIRRAQTLVGYHDVPFPEDERFSESYLAQAKDEAGVLEALQPRVREILLERDDVTVEATRTHVICYRRLSDPSLAMDLTTWVRRLAQSMRDHALGSGDTGVLDRGTGASRMAPVRRIVRFALLRSGFLWVAMLMLAVGLAALAGQPSVVEHVSGAAALLLAAMAAWPGIAWRDGRLFNFNRRWRSAPLLFSALFVPAMLGVVLWTVSGLGWLGLISALAFQLAILFVMEW